MARLFRQLMGIEAKMRQYEQGEAFIGHVERERGREFLDRVWAGPERLPTLAEIRDPQAWVVRMDRSLVLPS